MPPKITKDFKTEFQTPPVVCRYMVSLLNGHSGVSNVLEPTKGIGNIVRELEANGYFVTAPEDYFMLEKSLRFHAAVLNPPFSLASAIIENAPPLFLADGKGMKFGYKVLLEVMQKADIIIALMPWFTISDSDVRLRYIKNFGLKSITALPRKTFEYARIQTCVLELQKGYKGETEFKVFDLLPEIPCELQKTQTAIEFQII
jgi:type I restriction-modification system DNA methylase subunit